MQLFNVYQGGTLIFDIPTVTNITGHAKIQGNAYFYKESRNRSF
jgi:gamma-glutamyl-gamma-aminobutyrate hydrolase PuuD